MDDPPRFTTLNATGTCRACPAPIAWAENPKTGKKNPLNPEPDGDRGNIRVTGYKPDGTPLIEVLGRDDAKDIRLRRSEPLYLSHFVNCPARDRFRRN